MLLGNIPNVGLVFGYFIYDQVLPVANLVYILFTYIYLY